VFPRSGAAVYQSGSTRVHDGGSDLLIARTLRGNGYVVQSHGVIDFVQDDLVIHILRTRVARIEHG